MALPRPHSRSLCKGRCSAPGQIYLITAVTHNRKPLFHDFDRARVAVLALVNPAIMEQADTLAYVVMPDHFHWLMQLKGASLSRVVQCVKSKSGYEVNRLSQRSGKV